MASAWMRLPVELRSLPQWVVAGASKAPLTVSANGQLYPAKVTNPSDWMSFQQAVQVAWDNRELVTTDPRTGRTQTGLDIGFVLSESDPYSCIDLDIKDSTNEPDPARWTKPEQFDFFWNIAQTYDSYTERSRSGKGLHVWLIGNIGSGFRRDGVEVYSRERFIICTGDIIIDKPIRDQQALLTNMVTQMRPVSKKVELEELPEDEDDWSILQRAVFAANGDKFWKLWRGEWRDLEFPSQSEADLALMSMFTFYSKSNEQCRRLFWDSALGKREKAHRVDYINETLKTIRSRQAREEMIDLSGIAKGAALVQDLRVATVTMQEQAAAEITRLQGGVPPQGYALATPLGSIQGRIVTGLHVEQGAPGSVPPPLENIAAQMEPVIIKPRSDGLNWPPGFAGAIAQFIYQSAPRPVKEVAIVGALGLLAGICGKAWSLPQSGLNLYIILVARSAIGKEAMHSGISLLVHHCCKKNPFFSKYVDFVEYVSGQALLKACLANSCFVNVSSEWGRRLKKLANDDRPDGPTASLRTQMTNLYQKSGPQAIVGGVGYSSADNNVASVGGVSYSMIGETTPDTFFEAMTPSMMEDGFMSRFLTIQYDGQRPEQNPHMVVIPSDALVDGLNKIVQHAELLNNSQRSNPLASEPTAASLLSKFEKECDREINNTGDESRRQMWNRASLKAQRVAGLLAVADNYITPVMTEAHLSWAIEVVRRDIAVMKKRLDSGDVGSGDSSRQRKIVALAKEYFANDLPVSYKIPAEMKQNAIIPRKFLQLRCDRSAAFYNHKLGSNRALDDAINSLIAAGYMMEVTKDKLVSSYNYHGKAYRILELPDYDALSKTE